MPDDVGKVWMRFGAGRGEMQLQQQRQQRAERRVDPRLTPTQEHIKPRFHHRQIKSLWGEVAWSRNLMTTFLWKVNKRSVWLLPSLHSSWAFINDISFSHNAFVHCPSFYFTDDPRFSKYFQMIRSRVPRSWVERVIEVDDRDPAILGAYIFIIWVIELFSCLYIRK